LNIGRRTTSYQWNVRNSMLEYKLAKSVRCMWI